MTDDFLACVSKNQSWERVREGLRGCGEEGETYERKEKIHRAFRGESSAHNVTSMNGSRAPASARSCALRCMQQKIPDTSTNQGIKEYACKSAVQFIYDQRWVKPIKSSTKEIFYVFKFKEVRNSTGKSQDSHLLEISKYLQTHWRILKRKQNKGSWVRVVWEELVINWVEKSGHYPNHWGNWNSSYWRITPVTFGWTQGRSMEVVLTRELK